MTENRSGYGGARPKTVPPRPRKRETTRRETQNDRKRWSTFEENKTNPKEMRDIESYKHRKKCKSYESLKSIDRDEVPSSNIKEYQQSRPNFEKGPNDRQNWTTERSKNERNEDDFSHQYSRNTKFSGPSRKPKTAIETLTFLDGKDGDFIVRNLLERKELLSNWLVECQGRADVLPLILSVLSKAFSCRYLSHKTADLIQLTIEADLLNTIALHLVDLHLHGDFENASTNGLSTKVENILTIVLEMTSRNPSSTMKFSRVHLTLERLVGEIEKASGFSEERIMLQFGDFSERMNRSKKVQMDNTIEIPPDDFRVIDIFPGVQDVHSKIEPFIRKNKTKGGYLDLDHYLDIQFRLLREDFIGPLRDGINEYIRCSKQAGRRQTRNHDLRIYQGVQIISPVCLADGLCFKIQLSPESYERVVWGSSKRLIYGSLLCLTNDGFETFMIATVAGREIEDLVKGNLDIHFESSSVQFNARELFSTRFTMAETTAFFESYRHVLKGLQKFQEGDLPFEKYLLKCQTNISPPAYLTKGTTFDFNPLIRNTDQVDTENKSSMNLTSLYGRFSRGKITTTRDPVAVEVLNSKSWPTPEQLHLDESQFAAVKSAVTKEFSLIQGPPGTGKTYIGLKIAKLLLHNKQKITKDPKKPKPMLIVCYTNHALDQFLEGILSFFKGNILRVGSQSKSPTLQECSLRKAKSRAQLRTGRKDLIEEMQNVANSINKANAKIDCYRTFLLSMTFLRPFVNEKLFFVEDQDNKGKDTKIHLDKFRIERWLNVGKVLDRLERNRSELERMSQQKEADIPDIIALSNSRKVYDDAVIEFDKKRLEQREEVMRDLRKTAAALYYEDKIPSPDMDEKTWEKQRLRNIKANRIIQTYICYQDIMSDEDELCVDNPWRLSLDDRWRLYRLWVRRACEKQYEKIAALENRYTDLTVRYKEAQLEEDSVVMKRADVIGMTTTCAARYLALLQDIQPNIVIVEEAAEVLEAHIVTTLSKGCQQLILIGDHKQLRPSPSVYALATKFNLNVSLFERMIMNGVSFDTLELQHRMRPQISVLISSIYSNLKDHDSVKEYENIRGIANNVFLINHSNFEDTIDEGTSHSNKFEAEYLAALCKYLIQQGYSGTQITVLTTYTSQMFLLKRLIPKDEFEGVQVTVVDNYQGEENDIILLSLVRSNAEGNVGFLKTENRICVALSRAKKGFYMIGNFSLLALKSELWKTIVDKTTEAGHFGDGLTLYCQNHPETQPLVAREGKDFANAPEGGCKKYCKARLHCGHTCRMFCHPTDTTHELYKCMEKCTKSCERNHPCKKRCHQECGKCPEIIEKVLSRCKHVAQMPCGENEYAYHCKEECQEILSCGHKCQNDCGSSHTASCRVDVEKIFSCGHEANIPCWSVDTAPCKKEREMTLKCGHTANVPCKSSPDRAKCRRKCEMILECGHPCSGTCSSCVHGRFHQRCTKKCSRTLVCGHECLSNCNLCLPCTRKCENRCVHSNCTKLCGEPCQPCMEKCAWQCPHKKCTKRCSEPCNRGPCNKWCRKKLKCGHFCIGLCGEPCPKLCRVCDKEEVTTILFGNEGDRKARFILLQDCGHVIESRALDQYMKMEHGEGDTLVQLKGCPRCKTPIRKSYRYGHLINKVLADIEQVKIAIIGDQDKCKSMKERVTGRSRADTMFGDLCRHSRMSYSVSIDICNMLRETPIISEQHIAAFENQCRLLEALEKSLIEYTTKTRLASGLSLRSSDNKENLFEQFACEAEYPYREEDDKAVFAKMKRRLSGTSDILSDQEISEIKNEIARCNLMGKLARYERYILKSNVEKAKPDIEILQKISRKKIVTDEQAEIEAACERLNVLTSGMNITEDEKQMILKTVGLTKGHWFKCPNGHVYAIGECGGANQEGVCPECNAAIGGKQHKLAEGNTVATEMDGAKYGAYSEEANMIAGFLLDEDLEGGEVVV